MMDTAFGPHSPEYCPASFASTSTASSPSSNIPIDAVLPKVHNDALVYLAVAVATFAAVPSLFWLKDRRHKARERRRNRAVVESLKAKMDAKRALEEATKPPPSVAITVTPEPSVIDEHDGPDVDETKEKKKRSKDRRKRGRDREPSRSVRAKKQLPSSRPSPAPESERVDREEYTPKAPEQSQFEHIPHEEPRAPSPRPPSMPDIASPTPLSLISASSFHAPSPSPSPPQAHSETSSQPGPSRSASVSPTTAPLTPPSLPASRSLPPLVAAKTDGIEAWAPQLACAPHDDPAWDWDGQSSTYSAGSPSRAPSSLGSHHPSVPQQQRVKPTASSQRPAISSPASPASSAMPAAPSLIFPSLNSHPPPGASLAAQIASLKGALEASRTREDKHRRDAERWSKECDLVKWRWNEASDMWRRREAELQTQMHHLVHQLQTLTHAVQAASLSPPIPAFMSAPGQSPFSLAMPFPPPLSPFGGVQPFDPRSPSVAPDTVNEGLAEAILRRPESIHSATGSSSRNPMRRGGSSIDVHTTLTEEDMESGPRSKTKKHDSEEVVEFEFPTLLERRVNSARVDPSRDRETVTNVDGVDIFS